MYVFTFTWKSARVDLSPASWNGSVQLREGLLGHHTLGTKEKGPGDPINPFFQLLVDSIPGSTCFLLSGFPLPSPEPLHPAYTSLNNAGEDVHV